MQQEIINYPVYFNSADRLNQNDPSYRATFKIQDLVNLNSRKKAYLSMPYVAIPPTFYIISTLNNSVIVNESTYPTISVLTYTVTIPPGNYSVADFITVLTATMTEQSAVFGYGLTYGGSYSSYTGQLTIFITGMDTAHTFSYTFVGTNRDLKNFMGFNNSYDNITVPFPATLSPAQPNYSYSSPNPVNFASSIPSIYVRINIFRTDTCYDTSNGGGLSLEGTAGDIIQVVPINSNGFSQVNLNEGYQGIDQKRIAVSNILNSNITFTLTGVDNNFPVNLNGYDWQGVLMIQYTSETKK